MPSIDESLAALGLTRGVSSAEIEQAYRDLVRVWHPDRFGGDERLRKKAEIQTRKLNAAAEVLRRSYRPDAPSPPSTPRKEPVIRAAPRKNVLRVAPFVVKPVWKHQFALLLFTSFTLALALDVYLKGEENLIWRLVTLAIVAVSVRMAVRHCMGLLFPLPRFVLSDRGLLMYEHGLFGWPELEGVYAKSVGPLLVRLNGAGRKRFPLESRTFMKLRRWMTRNDLVVYMHAMSCHPIELVRTITLFDREGACFPARSDDLRLDAYVHLLWICFVVGVVMLFVRSGWETTEQPDRLLFYLSILVAAATMEELTKILRVRFHLRTLAS